MSQFSYFPVAAGLTVFLLSTVFGTEAIAEIVDESAGDPPTDPAHLGWMLVSSALVLFMTAPGLAMFYSGLVRKKNVIGVMMQCLFLMGLMSVIWALWGYSLSFGGGSAFIGNFDYLFLNGLTMQDGELPGGAVPDLVFMIFQGMFFVITPALICGAFAERMKFSAMVLFMVAWGTFVYCPLCHMVWGEGWLFFGGEGALLGGALDFAGGTVVHVSSGASALICALVMGPRIGFGKQDMRPHNLTYTAMGAAMLWVGWFGFNAGSAVAANDLAANAFVVTHLSASAGAVAWAAIEWYTSGKPSILGTASGAVAGLVCITPAAGFVQPMPALLMGLIAGVLCYVACGRLKRALRYDDSLDAFGIHGIGGAIGAVLTGVFATTDVNPAGADGVAYGGSAMLIVAQIAAVGVAIVISIVASFVILKAIDMIVGLRVDAETELQGLDISSHGEEGYVFN
ncbi:MAG: ammonium transporter [Planctomycetota bacterium]